MKKLAWSLFVGHFLVIFAVSAIAESSRKNPPAYLPPDDRSQLINVIPDSAVLSSCVGSFSTEGEEEYAASVYSDASQEVIVVGFLGQGAQRRMTEVARYRENPKYVQSQVVVCWSAMQVKRFNKGGGGSAIESITPMDTICAGDDAGKNCYEYRKEKNGFTSVNGWAN